MIYFTADLHFYHRDIISSTNRPFQDYLEIECFNTQFVLSHYPMVEWNGYYKGSVMLHGHQHNHADYNAANRKNGLLRYDVGVDANHMAPVSAEEIIAFFSC